MSFATTLAELQAEISCPICLDYLMDSVTADYGHSFCPFCIHQCWEDLQDDFLCLFCLHHFPGKNINSNSQLHHMTDT
ncbi:hypothetical protein P7K49_005744, partial [Saguinus oedipus]